MLQTLQQLDVSLFFFINKGTANPLFDFVCPLFRNKLFWTPAYLFLAIYFFKKYGTKAVTVFVAAAVVILVADQVSASVIKPFFTRFRPCNDNQIQHQVRLLVHCGSGFSFVSSHAANHFGISFFLMFFFRQKWLRFLFFFWACLVAFSQIYVGVHYPADVFFGGILGIVIGLFVGKVLVSKFFKSSNENISYV